jgi:uncharacterized protein YjbJ (UPF0337 family)
MNICAARLYRRLVFLPEIVPLQLEPTREEMAMNEDIVKGKWKELKGNVRQQWGKLTNDEVDQLKGTHEELVGLLQQRYGYEKDQAKKEVDDWAKRY